MTQVLVVAVAVVCAFLSRYLLHLNILTFFLSALALIGLSKILGDATEEFSAYVGQGIAGFVNVTLSNLAEIIIIFVAVRSGALDLVRAGIVGSIVGNLLLIMGLAIYLGCKKNNTLKFNPHTASLFINQFFIVAVALLLPTLFHDRIPQDRRQMFSYLLSLMLVGAYFYYYRLSLVDPRFRTIDIQTNEFKHQWSKKKAVGTLLAAGVGAFFMSEFLVEEVNHVAKIFSVSHSFIGFIVLPMLGNVAEHMVAVTAARKRLTELSLAIAVGSASQVGMIVAPCAVLFGVITGNIFILDFSGLPLELLFVSLVGAYLVLRDSEWNISEGIMLLALYIAMAAAFLFSQ